MRASVVFFLWLFLLIPHTAQAKSVTFEEQYAYDASEADSLITCRAISLLQVKRLLLERLGTYLESRTEVVNSRLTKDQLTSLSAGIVKTEIIDEKWDGKIYTLTARIEADPDTVAAEIAELRKSSGGMEKIEQLESMNEQSIEKIEDLKNELKRIQGDLVAINNNYESASKIVDALYLYETGLQFSREGNYDRAVKFLTEAVEADPNYRHYFERGRSYMGLKQFGKAVEDFSMAISLTPDMRGAYFHRGRAYRKMGEKSRGMNDIKKAAELGSGSAKRWLKMKKIKNKKSRKRS